MRDSPEQLELNFRAPVDDGFANWQWEQKEAVRRVSEFWGLPLGKNVRVRLAGIDGEFEGVMVLAELPRSLNRREPLRLRIGRHVFESREIDACAPI